MSGAFSTSPKPRLRVAQLTRRPPKGPAAIFSGSPGAHRTIRYGRPDGRGRGWRETCRTAGVCAFSLTSRITQRDGTTGRDAPGSRNLLYPGDPDRTGRLHRDVHGRPAACRNPGLLDDSGVASASRPRIARGPQAPGRQPGHPGARFWSPAASGRPGRVPVHPLRRDPRSAPPPGGRSPCVPAPCGQARRTGTPAHPRQSAGKTWRRPESRAARLHGDREAVHRGRVACTVVLIQYQISKI
jgi:hypothetical protein